MKRNNSKLTNEDIDLVLLGRPIKRIGEIINTQSKTLFECKVCSYRFISQVGHIIYRGDNCPKCGGKVKLTNELIDERLLGRNILRIGSINNSINEHIEWQCQICNNIWTASINNILNKMTGCHKCKNYITHSNDYIDIFLKDKNIKRIDDYINNKILITFLCLICNNQWKTAPQSLLNRGTGCPCCNSPGATEKKLLKMFNELQLVYHYNFNIKNINYDETHNYRLDFYFPEVNLAIEYNGHQHYRPARFGNISQEIAEQNLLKQQKRDQYVNEFCINNNIKLIWIDGRIYTNKKLKQYIIEILINNYIILQP